MSNEPIKTGDKAGGILSRPAYRVALVTGAALLGLIGLIAVLGFTAGSTVTCSRCHVAQTVALARSPHSKVACETCHFSALGPISSRVDVAVRMLPASATGVRLTGPGRPVGSAACLGCHAGQIETGVVSKNGLRINHARCATTSACEDCHSQSAHGTATRFVRGPSMAACVACHTKERAPLKCTTCHEGKLTSARSRDPEWVREHGPNWKTMHGTGNLASCGSCHAPSMCRTCHKIDLPHPANFGAKHGAIAESVGTEVCLTCHKTEAYCDGCHGTPMPHPAGFLQKHSKVATSETDPKCVTCHVADDCKQCHVYHVHPGGTQPPVGRTGGGV